MEILSSGRETAYIECACNMEHIQIISDFDVYANEINPSKPTINQSYYLSFYGYGHVHKKTFWSKLRHIWSILKTGSPYSDMIIMKPDEAKKLAEFINHTLV